MNTNSARTFRCSAASSCELSANDSAGIDARRAASRSVLTMTICWLTAYRSTSGSSAKPGAATPPGARISAMYESDSAAARRGDGPSATAR